MVAKEVFLPIDRERIAISVFKEPEPRTTVLFLFGGSQTTARERFFEWQQELLNHDINSVSFDYIGTGQSSGNFYDSSLARRIEESIFVFEWMKKSLTASEKVAICGGSLGAYVALGLMHRFREQVTHLMLFCPAAYTRAAHKVQFGPQFTQVISQPDSWQDSLAFDWLEEFQGHLLFILPQHDEVIPADITQAFLRQATHAHSVEKAIIANSSHQLLAEGKLNEAVRQQVYRKSLLFFKNK